MDTLTSVLFFSISFRFDRIGSDQTSRFSKNCSLNLQSGEFSRPTTCTHWLIVSNTWVKSRMMWSVCSACRWIARVLRGSMRNVSRLYVRFIRCTRMRRCNRRISSNRFVVVRLLVVGIRLVDGRLICWVDRVAGWFVVCLGFVVARVVRVGRAKMVSLTGWSVVLRVIAVQAVTVTVLIVSGSGVFFIVAAFMVARWTMTVQAGVVVLGVVAIIGRLIGVLGTCKINLKSVCQYSWFSRASTAVCVNLP